MIIGLDVGTKKTGVAKSDPDESVAFPHTTVSTKQLLQAVEELLQHTQATCVVIGEAKGRAGEDTPVKTTVESMQKILEEKGLEVVLVPEQYTSALARRSQSTLVDASAAALILQSYLDQQNSKE